MAALDKERAGVTCCGWICVCSGEESGEPLEREDWSDEAEWMDCLLRKKISVNSFDQRMK